jgi:hypothetical protein
VAVVTKVNDVTYTADYRGFQMSLSMQSADDPAGLRGFAEVSYPDAGGFTRERISISIPDSSTLTESGTWAFERRSDGAFCLAESSITGSR